MEVNLQLEIYPDIDGNRLFLIDDNGHYMVIREGSQLRDNVGFLTIPYHYHGMAVDATKTRKINLVIE